MELNINLNLQLGKKGNKTTLRIFAAITFVLAVISGLAQFMDSKEGSFVLGWFYLIYFLLFSAALFFKSNGKHIFDLIGKSYIKLNEEGVECKMDLLKKKVIKFKWSDVEYISMKLFEIKVKANKQIETINLEKLSDENLQLVKSIFKKHQAEIVEKDMLVIDSDY